MDIMVGGGGVMVTQLQSKIILKRVEVHYFDKTRDTHTQKKELMLTRYRKREETGTLQTDFWDYCLGPKILMKWIGKWV